ncbi:DUF4157 domain-containing protein [Undibacterium sp. Di26W]|uniref:eCIS core domain-containing protein n=1 Tax=Undibacterium sp. Di26W TaxID=3413035 RepID=UPI003BF05414
MSETAARVTSDQATTSTQTVTQPAQQLPDEAGREFFDQRPIAQMQRRLQDLANTSPQAHQLRSMQQLANNSPQARQLRSIRHLADNSHNSPQIQRLPVSGKTDDAMKQAPSQRQVQGSDSGASTVRTQVAPASPNRTGLPDELKTGVENLSGMSLDHVKVHYNSSQPAQLQAHAYAQGSDIHLAPGQEQHLPHEAWHVVQQMQGRVQATTQMKQGVPVNDDAGLENEADVMGARALASGAGHHGAAPDTVPTVISGAGGQQVVQGAFIQTVGGLWQDMEAGQYYKEIARDGGKIQLMIFGGQETLNIYFINDQWLGEWEIIQPEIPLKRKFTRFGDEKRKKPSENPKKKLKNEGSYEPSFSSPLHNNETAESLGSGMEDEESVDYQNSSALPEDQDYINNFLHGEQTFSSNFSEQEEKGNPMIDEGKEENDDALSEHHLFEDVGIPIEIEDDIGWSSSSGSYQPELQVPEKQIEDQSDLAVHLGREHGMQFAEESNGKITVEEKGNRVRRDFIRYVGEQTLTEEFFADFESAFDEAVDDVIEENGWQAVAEHGVKEDIFQEGEEANSFDEFDEFSQEMEAMRFSPSINYTEKDEDDNEIIEEENEGISLGDEKYDHRQWEEQQKQQLRIAAAITGRNALRLGESDSPEKNKQIFFHVINTGVYSEKAVYANKKWTEKILPQMKSDGRKMAAGDIFNAWMKQGAVTDEDVPRLNRKLQSLQTQFDLDASHLVHDAEDSKMYAELTASPSIYVPVTTKIVSGQKGSGGGTDKLDAVQYDGQELGPLGQFLKNINKHYMKEEFEAGGSPLPKVNKNDTLLNSGNDSVTETFYRPGSVEAVSTSPRGKGRSGTGESKVGRMGVQEELINTGDLLSKQYEGGHLIGDQIMDPTKFNLYESWNLAPQENEFNAPVYSSVLENGATKAVTKKKEVHVKAEVSYPSDTYEVPVSDLVDRVMDGKTETIGGSGITWHDGIDYIQKNTKNSSLPTKFKFMTRIPGYWHANAKDVSSNLEGSVTGRKEGVQVLTAINASSIYSPTAPERFMFSVFTDGDSSTGTVLPFPVKPKSKPQATYKKAKSVYLYARQKTSVSGGAAASDDMRTMTATEINAVVKNMTRSTAIVKWLKSNPGDHTLKNLTTISGVGAATLKKIISAKWTI